MPFHEIKCSLVPLKALMLEVAMGPSTSFLEESIQSFVPPSEQAPIVAKDHY